METFLSLRHINKTFHATRALRDVSLDFMSGEVHCLAGQNGCGKSTLIKIMSGVYRPDEGAWWEKLVKADTRRFGGAGDSGDLSGPLFIS
ncbi:ATP-binding cassette domain-containing protein [Escherichia coli]|nr:ATP-binding cassette domain-containing protein [Escherichia coli]